MDSFFIAVLIICGLLGFLGGGFYAWWSVRRIQGSYDIPETRAQEIIEKALQRKQSALELAEQATRERLEEEARRREEERDVVRRIHEKMEAEIQSRQAQLDAKALELAEKESEIIALQHKILQVVNEERVLQAEVQKHFEQYQNLLLQKAQITYDAFKVQLVEEYVSAERLKASRFVLESIEDLKLHAAKYGKEILNLIVGRYDPKFIWPKNSFTVLIPDKALIPEFFTPGSKLLTELGEGLGIHFDLHEGSATILKMSGGAGVEKEAIRLALEEVLARSGTFSVDKVLQTRERYRKILDRQVLKLGEDAAKMLGLQGLHPEILKLVGSLNYRTSHRQNQYWHSIEVATFAGMLAIELGVSPEIAKRAALLHDIGKVLDYRIEGSHAVISADCALRYGESQDVVDIILSHHDDKPLDSVYADILKAADAMSGARPGARMEMEEGYQKRMDAITAIIQSFADEGVVNSAIMHAGREVHVYVDSKRVTDDKLDSLAAQIAEKLENSLEYPGQIRVTVVRRFEIVEVA